MQLTSLELSHFNTYDKLGINFGDGLTLVVGDNGTGKSTVIEGIVWTVCGITIRGESPENGKGACRGYVSFRDAEKRVIEIHRKRAKKRTDLKLVVDGEDQSGQTATETQDRIDRLVQPPRQFIAARIFAKEFLQRFAAATDKERKALLEGVLGLGRFDVALNLVRQDMSVHKQALASGQGRLREQRNNLTTAIARLDAAPDVKGNLEELEDQRGKLKLKVSENAEQATKIATMLNTARREMDSIKLRIDMVKGKVRGQEQNIEQYQQQQEHTLANENCPVCFQPMSGGADKVKAHFAEQIAGCESTKATLLAKVEQLEADLLDAQEVYAALSQQDSELRAATPTDEIHDIEKQIAALRAQAGERSRLEQAVEEARKQVKELEKVTGKDAEKVIVLDQVAKVMGLRGARTMLLNRALGRLESEVNTVLAELGMNLLVTISGTSALKSGKEVEAISIELNAGNNHYPSMSSGERARVDVGFLMGLSAMMGTGFVAFDEVFDALDPAGIDMVAEYLSNLSRERQVLVISHHEDLKSRFPRGTKLRAVKDKEQGSRLDVI